MVKLTRDGAAAEGRLSVASDDAGGVRDRRVENRQRRGQAIREFGEVPQQGFVVVEIEEVVPLSTVRRSLLMK